MTTISFSSPQTKKIPNLLKDASSVNHSQINPHTMLHKTFNFPQNSQNNKSFLDYTFISHKSKLNEQEEKHKALMKAKDYLFDLVNTWKLNLELLKNLSPDQSVPDLIMEIELKYQAQHKKIAVMKAKKSKILIESQIQEEYNRKIKESEQFYKEQIEGTQDNVFNKEEYIKIFLKKLKEVETFIQKHTKTLNVQEYAKYNIWKIAEFIKENTSSLHKRKGLYDESDKIRNQILELKQENYFYKEETMTISQKDNNKEMVKKKKEINKYIEKYRKSCHVLQTKIKLLKLTLSNLGTVKDFNVISAFNQRKHQPNTDDNELDIKRINTVSNQKGNSSTMIYDKSIEISKKIESLMDFSLMLNKKANNEESNINESNLKEANFNNITYAWNLSCIQKK